MSVSHCSWTIIDGNIVDITITGTNIYDCEGLEVAFNTVSSTQGDIVVDASTRFTSGTTPSTKETAVRIIRFYIQLRLGNTVTPPGRSGGPPREYTSKRARASTSSGTTWSAGSRCTIGRPTESTSRTAPAAPSTPTRSLTSRSVSGWTCRRATRCTGTISRTACSCSSTLRTTS